MYIFKEKQHFKRKFTFLILVAVSLLSLYAAYTYTTQHSADEIEIVQLLSFLLPIGVAFLIGNITLTTKVDEQGVHYQFFPFHLKLRLIKWSEMSKCFVREYNPITEFGGWGFRISVFRKKGIAYSVKGKIGLQIVLKNGKKILLGTEKQTELERVINTYIEKYQLLQ